jgi:hypothetical protein
MRGPPDPKCERATPPGSPLIASQKFNSQESSATVREVQAASLRRRFAIGYCVAAALAPLVWGLPR